MSFQIEQIKYIKYFTTNTDDIDQISILQTLFSKKIVYINENNYNTITKYALVVFKMHT
jgi:hypothetical protein